MGSARAVVFEACRARAEEFERMLEPFEEQGIIHSEMLAVCAVSEQLGADVVIESGRQRAQSTVMLAKWFAGKPTRIVSVELDRDGNAIFAEQRLAPYGDIDLIYGDALEVLPGIVSGLGEARATVLLDGPKGVQAVRLARELARSANVVGVFFHDAARSTETRRAAESAFADLFTTDDEEFAREFAHLDELCMPPEGARVTIRTWRPYARGESYGPTLAVALPTDAERAGDSRLLSLAFETAPRRLLRRGRAFLTVGRRYGTRSALRLVGVWLTDPERRSRARRAKRRR